MLQFVVSPQHSLTLCQPHVCNGIRAFGVEGANRPAKQTSGEVMEVVLLLLLLLLLRWCGLESIVVEGHLPVVADSL